MRISGKKSRRPLQGEIQKKEWVKRIRKEKMRMKKLFDYAAKYLERSDWKDLAMIKLCLFCVKGMWSVFMHQYPIGISVIIHVAADMIPAF